jgi:hypothetical protein
MAAPEYELSAHAAAVISERNIDIEWVERILASPDLIEHGKVAAELTSALGKIVERDGRVLRVVYNASVEPLRIVTVYFDRGLRGKL